MKRRKFIQSTALAATVPLVLNNIPVMGSSTLEDSNLQKMATAAASCGKILVVIQMSGGNDGLNTVFPMDKWSNLVSSRANILMPESAVLSLAGNATTGLHPAMPEMKTLYDEGKMMIVQGVSYPNPSFSHFRALDIWATASDSDKALVTGWLGRSLHELYPGFPEAYPNATMTDPLSIHIGGTAPLALQASNINMAYISDNPDNLISVINETIDPTSPSDYGAELKFLRLMKDQSNNYTNVIQTAYNYAKPLSATYPNGNSLADQLKIVAKLINGGLQTPVYLVGHPGAFDSHYGQVDATDKRQGIQANNLKVLSQAIGAFQEDLKIIGKANKVSGMTFSEFGRRVKSNDSLGTDHGTAGPVLFFGDMLNTGSSVSNTANPVSGMIGTSPNLPQTATVYDNVPMQFDYRQIYSTIMQDWLCLSETQATNILGAKFDKLPIFKKEAVSNIVHIYKRNAPAYAIDGNGGAVNLQQLYLYGSDTSNVNQQWNEIDRGNGYFSYQKLNTNLCIDGGNGGTNFQPVVLYTRDDNNQNQHWKKIDVGSGSFRLEKRNAPGFSIDGNNGGDNFQKIYLYDSNDQNQNQHWVYNSAGSNLGVEPTFTNNPIIKMYPNPTKDFVTISGHNLGDSIIITDMLGKTIVNSIAKQQDEVISTAGFTPGIYIVSVGGKKGLKLVKE
jgi:uncharacterized protein (DUF1501 family)